QHGEQGGEENRPGKVRDLWSEISGGFGAPDGANQRIQNVIHGHAPAGDVSQAGMKLAADVSKSRAGARVSARHASVADGGEKHGHHGDEDGGDYVAARLGAHHTEAGHGRGGLHDDDAVEKQVPQAEGAVESGGLVGGGGLRGHAN